MLTGKFVFQAWQDNSNGIFSIDVDGSNLRRITEISKSYYGPALSRDSQKIAASLPRSYRGAHRKLKDCIGIMNSDGSNEVRLTGEDSNYYLPSFSPDGKRIVCVSSAKVRGLAVIDIASGDLKPILNGNIWGAPVFTADGNEVIYQEDGRRFCSVDIEGNNQRILFEHSSYGLVVAVNPLGRQIAVCERVYDVPELGPDEVIEHDEDEENDEVMRFTLFLSDIDGSNRFYPCRNFWNIRWSVFSPDGVYFAVLGRKTRAERTQIYIFQTDGVEVGRVSFDEYGFRPESLCWGQ
ncbi:MAG: hypothetical protein EOP09_13565 [Proteobacteria bacterium]|nr:MAG: hypothetical protein EOP09_13565 [Pseudomonadota bacterium]